MSSTRGNIGIRIAAALLLMFAALVSLFPDVVLAVQPSAPNVIQNPLSGISTVSQFVEAILKGILAIGMPVAVFFIVLSGFRFIAAQGNQEKLSDAKNNFMWTIIGVAIFIGAWTLATLIASTLKQIGAGA